MKPSPLLRRLSFLLAGVLALATCQVAAQTPVLPPAKTGPAIAIESAPPRLVARDAQIPLRLESVAITTSIAGRLAQTSVELTFFNPNARVLEGELQFPLADGQEVTGMAMDFNGVMREAVPVAKARGQAVFEEVTRTRVDPALAEKTVGNNFKLRVYPIPAGGRKTVVLRYEESLTQRGADWIYRLPLAYGERVARFNWTGAIATSRAPRVLRTTVGEPEVTRSAAGFDLTLARQDLQLTGAAEIAITPEGTAPAATQAFEGATYFYAEPAVRDTPVPRKAPTRVAIAWDASGSGTERDHAREFGLLSAYFKRFTDVEVMLTVFRDRPEPAQRFPVARGDWSALRRALEGLAYDGATNFAALNGLGGADEMLLFSDGIGNYGEGGLARPGMPTYAIGAAQKADAAYLRALAEQSGGRYVDAVGQAPEAAARMLTARAARVSIESSVGVADLLLASAFAENGRVMLAGRLTEAEGQVVLRIDGAAAPARRVVVPIGHAGKTGGRLAAQRWARMRVAALEVDYDLNGAEVERLGKRFRLITRATSLIILDTAADYARNDIEPPADLRVEFDRLRAAGVAARETDQRAHLERIAAQFREKQTWWEREFPKDAKPAAVAKQSRDADDRLERREQGRARQDVPAAAPAPPPAPAPRPAAAPSMAARMASPEGEAQMSAREGSAMAKAVNGAAASGNGAIEIRLQAWVPDSAYARRLREADVKDLYRIYLDERESHRNSTAFFLDVADLLLTKGERALAMRVLSNLAEMNLENRHILRVLGYRLLQAGDATAALPVFRRVRDLSPNEPQSHRDLGLAYAQAGQAQKAVDSLYEVVSRPWHGRFPEVELIALAELNAVVAASARRLDTGRIDPRLLRDLPLDLRAVLTWDADNTDIDLWVTDPNGEKAFYGNRLTYQGGRMSADFTGGYGPEEFSLKNAKPGKYRIEAQFFGHRQQIVSGATTLQVRLTTRFGTAAAKEQLVTLRLKGGRDTVLVGEFEVGAD